MHDNDRLADVSMAFPDPSGANAYSKGQQGASRGYGYSGYDVSANLGRQHMETSQGFGLGMDAAGRARAAQQSVNISAELPRRNETSFEPYATGVPGVNSGQEGANGAANSKAVLAALRSLQEKIRALEEDRGSLQARLRASEETRVRDEQQHRLIQRQLQLQLQESVKSLTVRHEAESEAMRKHSSKVHSELQGSVEGMQHRLAEADRRAAGMQEKLSRTEEALARKEEELRSLKSSLVELEAADIALKKVNQRLEDQVVHQQAQREEISINFTRMEEELRSFKLSKMEIDERAEGLEGQCERLESENEGLRRQLASFRDQCREAEDKLAQQAEEVGAGTARSYALEREKRQLEESLKNVLVINDQLLQKVYDVSLGQGPTPDQLPAYLDADATKATETLRAKRATTTTKKKVAAQTQYTGHAYATGPRPHYTVQTASSRPKRLPLSAMDVFPERSARRPTSTEGVRKSKSSSNLLKDVHSPSLQAMDAADLVTHGNPIQRLPMDDIRRLEGELVDEVRQLRRQYREICAQVQGAEDSQFDTQQLNVALRSVVDKLEKKGKQIQLIERMESQLSAPRR